VYLYEYVFKYSTTATEECCEVVRQVWCRLNHSYAIGKEAGYTVQHT